MTMLERVTGSLVGLAVGDALGFPAEFRSRRQILDEIGPAGITDFLAQKDPRFSRPFIVGRDHPPGTYTDDTQMTLALASGLLAAESGSLDDRMAAIARAFVAWSTSDDNDRAPGGTCMAGCAALARGVPWREAGVKDSKGCGSAMRVAPIGLLFDDVDEVLAHARASSLLTHGHDAAIEGAAACALMVRLALDDVAPRAMWPIVHEHTRGRSADFDRVWLALDRSWDLDPSRALAKGGLGESWVAEEAAASALYCCARAPDDFRAAVLVAVNTDGDSDSIACIAGSILGARLGLDAIDEAWRDRVENASLLLDVGAQLFAARTRLGAQRGRRGPARAT